MVAARKKEVSCDSIGSRRRCYAASILLRSRKGNGRGHLWGRHWCGCGSRNCSDDLWVADLACTPAKSSMKTSVANPIIPYLLLRLRIASRGHDVLFRGAGRGYELGDRAGDLNGLIEFAIRQVRWSCLARNFGLPRLKPRSSRGWKELSSAFPKQFFLKMY